MALDDEEQAMRDRALDAIRPTLEGDELDRALARGTTWI